MFNLYKYSLPLLKPFQTAIGTFRKREGCILRYRDHQTDHISESAPLPGFSKETSDDVIALLKENQQNIDAFFKRSFSLSELRSFLHGLPTEPSFQFGISSLGAMIIADRHQSSISELTGKDLLSRIQVNALCGIAKPHGFTDQVSHQYQDGFKTIKCKVSDSPGHLPDSMKSLASKYPGIRFRLDANRSWPLSKVEEFSGLFSGLPIEYIEEPCRITTKEDAKNLLNNCRLPVAFDETILELGLTNLLKSDNKPDYYILKPMLLGNLIPLFETITNRDHLENRFIFTTTLESAVGRRIIYLIAGILGSKHNAHGLNTGTLFKSDLTTDRSIRNGFCSLMDSSDFLISFSDIDASFIKQVL